MLRSIFEESLLLPVECDPEECVNEVSLVAKAHVVQREKRLASKTRHEIIAVSLILLLKIGSQVEGKNRMQKGELAYESRSPPPSYTFLPLILATISGHR